MCFLNTWFYRNIYIGYIYVLAVLSTNIIYKLVDDYMNMVLFIFLVTFFNMIYEFVNGFVNIKNINLKIYT